MYYGWEKDSKIPSRYVHPDEKGLKIALHRHSGVPIKEEMQEITPTAPKLCPRCKRENSAFAHFCMLCGLALDTKIALEI
jgi:hypothetical protein